MDNNKLIVMFGGAIISVCLAIAGWYLQRSERELQFVARSLNDVELTLTEVRVSLSYFTDAFASHISDPDNHPDNTTRVDSLREDIIEINRDLDRIKEALDP